ncbi:MAG: batten's disease protein Cln3 [Monoraphidium minutum]|nr:MAG: batten's disease protein Cln3 [Monoraphidium minutum]
MSWRQRIVATLKLWPYTVPLFVVYWAEYTMQSGVWSSIGFPVADDAARKSFYLWSNWTYQAAVFISRSSGTLLPVGRRGLWAMPAAQCGLLVFFTGVAAMHWWYNWGLLALCFVAGLLGGATYVNAFVLLSKETPAASREFSLAAACVADSLGIAAADAGAVFLQGCLMRANGLAGRAVFKCGGG